MFTIHQLRIFALVARARSLAGAMEVLHLTQPAVTYHVKTLEKNWKLRLFDRRRHRMEPTPAAHKFLPAVEELVRLTDETEDLIRRAAEHAEAGPETWRERVDRTDGALRSAASQLTDQVTIGVGAAICLNPIFALIREARARRPDLTVSVERVPGTEVASALMGGTIDLALCDRRPRERGLRSRRFLSDRVVLVVPPDHPWAGCAEVTPADLVGQAIVLYPHDDGLQRCVEAALAKHRIQFAQLPVTALVDSPGDVIEAVAAGLGIAFVPEAFAQNSSSKTLVIPIDGVQIRREIFLVQRQDETLSPTGRGLEAFLRTPLAAKLLAGEG